MNPQIMALIDRYDRLAATLEDQVIQRINTRMDEALRDLERELSRRWDTAADLPLLAQQRRAVLIEQLSGLLQVIRPELAGEYEALFQEAIATSTRAGGGLAEQMLQALQPDSVVRAFAGVPIEAIAAQARDASRRLYRYNDTFISKASAVVETGLAQGWGVRKVAAQLRREVGVTKSRAEMIARTETLAALNTGAEMAYQQNGIEYAIVMATADDRTCTLCAARNGRAYKLKDLQVPFHVRCRCFTVPFDPAWTRNGILDVNATRQQRDRSLAELESAGKKPNYGVSPFEKAAGRTKPPTPVWTP